ncbi:hypothetical protein HMPREF1980_00083 [Actinomyces sp. oral taxon 172 str. F0311]|nr:hypothetical protein HMPREF1980_00083 [Actinomyces sp. oral taxon 172 str. F0311]
MNQAETKMNNLRTNSTYAFIVLFFATAIAIIEFIHFDNQTWHRIAFSFLFPVLAQLITVSVATFIIAPYISKQSQQSDQNIVTEENRSTQQNNEASAAETAHDSTNEAEEETEEIDKGNQAS